MFPLLKKTKFLEKKVDEFLDVVNDTALHFQDGIKFYLADKEEDFNVHLTEVRNLEHKADELRREIESHLYTHTLIPESRGDVLALLETTDHIPNRAKETLTEFSIERPEFPEQYREGYMQLVEHAVQSVDAVVNSTRAFFRDVNSVNDYLHKVYFFEKEADRDAEKVKREVFADTSLELAHKMHLRYFALHIDLLADYAEDVADRLAIYSIKRST